jgi:ABC-2 type transport system permease protein
MTRVPALPVAWVLARRTWLKTLRRPVTLTFSLVQPLLWMTFFGFLFHRYEIVGLEGAGGLRYLDFLAPGVCAMTVLFGASQSGIGWIRDLQTGFLPRMLRSPAPSWAILLGKLGADVLRLVVQALLVLVLGLILGARVAPVFPQVLWGLLCLVLFALAFASLSCAIALITRAQESMAVFVHLVNMPLLFTSSALVPGKQMPEWLAAIARFNPLTLAVDAWRGAILLHEPVSFLGQIVPLVVVAGALFLLAASAMRRVPLS